MYKNLKTYINKQQKTYLIFDFDLTIAKIDIDPTQRPYTDHQEYCLFFSKGICGKCIPRCPVDALSESGHDKIVCRAYLKPKTEEYVKENFKFNGYGCGLCQTKVPCESKIPLSKDVEGE